MNIGFILTVSHYIYNEDLKCTSYDAQIVERIYKEKLGINNDNIIILDPNETKDILLDTIRDEINRRSCSKIGNYNIFFYFSGHGFDDNNGQYAILANFKAISDMRDKYVISKEDLCHKICNNSNCTLIAFFDMCRIEEEVLLKRMSYNNMNAWKYVCFFSCTHNQVSRGYSSIGSKFTCLINRSLYEDRIENLQQLVDKIQQHYPGCRIDNFVELNEIKLHQTFLDRLMSVGKKCSSTALLQAINYIYDTDNINNISDNDIIDGIKQYRKLDEIFNSYTANKIISMLPEPNFEGISNDERFWLTMFYIFPKREISEEIIKAIIEYYFDNSERGFQGLIDKNYIIKTENRRYAVDYYFKIVLDYKNLEIMDDDIKNLFCYENGRNIILFLNLCIDDLEIRQHIYKKLTPFFNIFVGTEGTWLKRTYEIERR